MNFKKLLITLFFAVTAFFLNTSVLFGQSPEYLEALKYYYNKETEKASVAFKKLTTSEPDNDAVYFYAGLLSKNNDETEKYFKKALELDPQNFWYKYNLALFYANSERIELTAKLFDELIAEYPQKSSLYFDAINIYINQNDTEKALSTLEKIEERTGKSEIIAFTKIELLLKSNKQKEAYEFLENYYHDCRTPKIACALGDYYSGLYDDTTALKFYNEATELDPAFVQAYFSKAHIYRALRQYDLYFENIAPFMSDPNVEPSAKTEYMNMVMETPQFVQAFAPQIDTMVLNMCAASPKDSLINSFAGIYYYRTGRVGEAMEILQANMERYPNSFDAAFTYILMLYYAEDWNAVVENVNKVLTRFSPTVDLMQLRGISFWRLKEVDNAISDYKKMYETAPQDSAAALSAFTALGDLYHMKDDNKQAIKYFEKALKINPYYSPVLNNYAYYISEDLEKSGAKLPIKSKLIKKAISMSKITIEKEPDNPTYLDTYAWLLHLSGLDLEAKAFFKHAMIYGGKESSTVLTHYATVLEALNENDLAAIYREQAKRATAE